MIIVLLALWAWVAWQLLENFNDEIERLETWRSVLLQFVLVIFAPIFFAEEMLEILIDYIIGDEE